MEARKNRTALKVFLCFGVLFSGTEVALAVFGMDAAAMTPHLIRQIVLMRKALQTANRTLGAVKDLERGIRNVRDYSVKKEAKKVLRKQKDINAVQREWRRILKGGSKNVDGIRELRKYVDQVQSKDPHYNTLDTNSIYFRKIQFDQTLVDDADHLLVEQVEQNEEYEKAGSEILDYASRASSGSEAMKINAEAQGIMVKQQTDELKIQTHQLKLSQAILNQQTQKNKNEMISHKVENSKIATSFLNLQPMR